MLYNTHKRICRECRAIANATIWEKITKSQMHHHNIAAYIVYMHTFGYCGYLPPKNWILSGNSWCQTVLWARCVCRWRSRRLQLWICIYSWAEISYTCPIRTQQCWTLFTMNSWRNSTNRYGGGCNVSDIGMIWI